LLLSIICLASCDHPHLYEKYYGIYIDHSLRQGSGYKDSSGIEHGYFYVRTTLTNDSTVPVHIKLHIPNGHYQTANGKNYHVFLMSTSMESENDYRDHNPVGSELKKFFNSGLENPYTVDTILKPNEACTVYIGLVTEVGNGLNPYLSIFSRGHKPHFWPSKATFGGRAPTDSELAIPDSAIHRFFQPTEKRLSVFLGVSMTPLFKVPEKYYNIIPCGEVSYFN
jgi:hypothetical protein